MMVKLLSYTRNADVVCGMASATCTGSTNWERALKTALKSGHDSVLEHCTFTFEISDISRACSHQLVRHRLASYSQESQRYVRNGQMAFTVPQSVEDNPTAKQLYHDLCETAGKVYLSLIGLGIPQEDARYVLPNATCTRLTMTMNGRELMHFFALRCCQRAQWEIRELAEKMLELVKSVAPIIFSNAGASCVQLGYCPEARGCGRYPTITDLSR